MIPASYLFRDTLARRWGRDFQSGADGLMQPARFGPSRLQTARELVDLAFGTRRER